MAATANQSQSIEADPGVADYGSDYDSAASDTTSLASSLFDYTYENGRRYQPHREEGYLLPNDEKEQDRLDMTHHVFKLTLGGDLCVTKLDHPQRILDVGTGTGIWAIEMGETYPSAEVIGTDLDPIQPLWVHPNVRFEVEDASTPWTFPKDHFDFIHIRTLGGSIRDFPALLKRCYKHLKPGGKVEIAEGRTRFFCNDDTFPDTCYTSRWLSEFLGAAEKFGIIFDPIPQVPGWLAESSFVDIEEHPRVVPLGPWPKDKHLKEIGRYFRCQFMEGALEAYSLKLLCSNNWTNEEVQVLLAHVRNEVKSNKMHIYTYCTYVTGTKPKQVVTGADDYPVSSPAQNSTSTNPAPNPTPSADTASEKPAAQASDSKNTPASTDAPQETTSSVDTPKDGTSKEDTPAKRT
ncbi:hypothetical protein MMC16_002671 [Acarospora aff. strigata]|nr:hypothetical protein [Acarospora aff. strigata]